MRITDAIPEESLDAFVQLCYDEGFISALPDGQVWDSELIDDLMD